MWQMFGSIKLELATRYSGIIVCEMFTYKLKLPAFIYTHRENLQS